LSQAIGLLYWVETFEFDARIRRPKSPVHRADSLVSMLLPTLNLLTEILNRGDIVRQTLPCQHA
jgi:hypothetical protein